MKVEISYFSSPQIWFSRFPIATRILTTNLRDNNKFKVHLTDQIPLICYSKAFSAWKNTYSKMVKKETTYDIYATGSDIMYGRFPLFYIFTGALDSVILENIHTDIIFFTSYTILDLRIVKILLNDNRKVVLGGTPTIIYSFDEIRNYLLQMGVPLKKLKDNLIIVSGYVDRTTDLYKIYEKWEDCKITENDFTTFWDCTEDGFIDHLKIYRQLFNTNINALMSSKCWWGKCRFCTYTCLPQLNFAEGVSVDKMVSYFEKISANYQSNNIFFNDSYMVNTPYNIELMKKLSDKGIEVSIYTGVKLLSNEKYIDFLNESNMGRICIGLESINDFSLQYLNKGYKFKDVRFMLDLIKRKLSTTISPVMFIMVDLPLESGTKSQAINEIKKVYRSLYDIRGELADSGLTNGVGCQFNFSPLRHLPKTDLVDNFYLRHATKDQLNHKTLIGITSLWNYFHEKFNIPIDEIENSRCLSEPIVRYLKDGTIMDADFNYIEKEVLEGIHEWRF